MTYLTGEVTVVHDWTKIDFANYIYSRVHFTRTLGNVVINGATIVKKFGVSFDIVVDPNTTIIDDPFTVLLGNPKPVFKEYENPFSESSFYFNFNNSNRFDCGVPPAITTDLTISIWAKPEESNPPSPPGDGYMVDTYTAGRGYALVHDRGAGAPYPVWSFFIGTTATAGIVRVEGNTNIVEDEWAHICGVWNDTTNQLKIYLNGEEDGSVNLLPQTLMNSGQVLRIGAGNTGSNEFNGLLNNCRIWNAALTSEQVKKVFDNGVTYNGAPDTIVFPQASSLQHWYKLGDDSKWDGSNWQMPDQIGTNPGVGSTNLDFATRRLDAPGKLYTE